MELRQLRYFLVLAEKLHFARAAESLHLSPAALSEQIAKLETEFNTRLLVRTNRTVGLTPAGTALLGYARRVVGLADMTVQHMHRVVAGEAGELRVAYCREELRTLHAALDELQAFAPEIHVTTRELWDGEVAPAVAAGEYDVGLCRFPDLQAGTEIIDIKADRYVVWLSRDHDLPSDDEVSLAELSGTSLLIFPRDYAPGLHDAFAGACAAAGCRSQLTEVPFPDMRYDQLALPRNAMLFAPPRSWPAPHLNARVVHVTDGPIVPVSAVRALSGGAQSAAAALIARMTGTQLDVAAVA